MTDTVRYLPAGSEEWRQAVVMSRGGKATGKNQAYFHVQNDGEVKLTGLNFNTGVDQWHTVPESEIPNTENAEQPVDMQIDRNAQTSDHPDAEVNINFLPISRHGEHAVRHAKTLRVRELEIF